MLSHVSQVDIALLERRFDRSPDVAFFVKDAAGGYVAVNESLVARHGLKSRSQVIGKCPRDICHGDFGRGRVFCFSHPEMTEGLEPLVQIAIDHVKPEAITEHRFTKRQPQARNRSTTKLGEIFGLIQSEI